MAQLLMRTDPFREFDRLAQQLFRGNGTLAYPGAMPMDAWREGDTFVVEFDLSRPVALPPAPWGAGE